MAKKSPQKKSQFSDKSNSISSKTQEKLFPEILPNSENPLLKKVFFGSLIFILFSMVFLSQNSGINGDDYFQDAYSEQLLDWYTSFGKDTSCFYHPRGPIQHYGGIFEIIAGATNRALGLDNLDPAYHNTRHFWNAIFGFIAVVFVGYFSRNSFGILAGIIAIWALFLSPRFLGHSLMNPKDIPFAAGYVMGLFFIYKLIKELPKPSKSTIIGLVVGIGVGFGIRAGGLILVGYLGIFVGISFLLIHGLKGFANKNLLINYIKWSLIPVALGLVFGLLFWPYALVDPLKHVPEALASLSNYGVNIRMLFNSEMIFAKDIPVYYTSLWMLVTLPLFCFGGLLLFLIFFKPIFKKTKMGVLMAIFAFLFPLLFVIVKKSPMYDGWRHMIFPFVPLVILISYGISFTLEKFWDKKLAKYLLLGFFGIFALDPIVYILQNPAIPYTYFNPLIGGTKGALGKFELDYWGVSTRQAVNWLEDQKIVSENMRDTITIASDFNYSLERYLLKKYKGKAAIKYVKYRQRYDQKWDYGVFSSRFLDGAHLRNGTWPPKSTVYEIKAGGVPVCIIMRDEQNVGYLAQQSMKNQSYSEAITLFEQALKKDDYNELALIGLADAAMSVNDFAKAEEAIKRHDEIVPQSYITQNLTGLLNLRQNKPELALIAFSKAVKLQNDNGTGYYYLAYIYSNQEKYSDAIFNIKKAIEASPNFKAAYELAAQIFEKSGDPGSAAAYRQAAGKI